MNIKFENPTNLDPETFETGDIFAPRFDTAGLVTAVAVEYETNDILMLAHMNADALSLTLETGIVHYFSRSRDRIWKKGETSGELQHLVEMRVDCDQDALILFVKQQGRGAACHTGRKSCFFRRVETDGEDVRLVLTGEKPLFDPKTVYKKS